MLTATKAPEGINSCISIENPSQLVRRVIRTAVCCNRYGDVRYELAQKAHAFLQCDYPDYVLVEFWSDSYQPFVDLLNELIEKAYTQRLFEVRYYDAKMREIRPSVVVDYDEVLNVATSYMGMSSSQLKLEYQPEVVSRFGRESQNLGSFATQKDNNWANEKAKLNEATREALKLLQNNDALVLSWPKGCVYISIAE